MSQQRLMILCATTKTQHSQKKKKDCYDQKIAMTNA